VAGTTNRYVQGEIAVPSLHDVFEEHQLTVPPRLLNPGQWLPYPAAAREMGFRQGRVVVVVQFSIRGQVEHWHVEWATHPVFLRGLDAHLRRLQASPGQVGGYPVRSRLRIPLWFRAYD
jgi:outer membrane biosynthesis protein TonB